MRWQVVPVHRNAYDYFNRMILCYVRDTERTKCTELFLRYVYYNIMLKVHASPYWFDDNFVEKDFVLQCAPANNKFAIFRDSAFIFSS